jgi:hypothetical protein
LTYDTSSKINLEEMSDDFLSGYGDSFFDAVDVVIRDYCSAKGMPEDSTEDCVNAAIEGCAYPDRREDARFSRIMDDYHEAAAETPITECELPEDDFERGGAIGIEHGLLEGIFYLIEKDGAKIMAEPDSNWALHQFWWLYDLGSSGVKDMFQQQREMLESRLAKLNGSSEAEKIIPFEEAYKPELKRIDDNETDPR